MRDARRAVWGQHVVAVSFEVAGVDKSLQRLKELDDGSPAATIQAAIGELNRSILEGGVEQTVASATRCRHLLPRVTDPLITTSFFVRLALASILSGQYLRAFNTAEEGVSLAESTRSKFAIIHFAPVLIGASIGLRRFRHASILLEDLTDRLRTSQNTYETVNAAIYRARLLLAQGSPDLAAAHLDRELLLDAPAPALRLEGLALLALALAVQGQADDVLESVELARKSSREADGVVLAALAHAVQGAATAAENADERLATAMKMVRTTSSYDSFVQTYRAYPEILRKVVALRLLPTHKLSQVLQNAVDMKLAQDAGFHIEPRPMLHESLLTAREREVYTFLCNGLSNKEIATALVISESTAKVHVRHILEKLGVTNRAQAVRASQETF
jgi:ATP/maltotriose-dependent transcriptional regulator MalT